MEELSETNPQTAPAVKTAETMETVKMEAGPELENQENPKWANPPEAPVPSLPDDDGAPDDTGGDGRGERPSGFQALRQGMERLAELHDVQAVLTASTTQLKRVLEAVLLSTQQPLTVNELKKLFIEEIGGDVLRVLLE